jgi:hypothetical protein
VTRATTWLAKPFGPGKTVSCELELPEQPRYSDRD